MTFFDIIAGIWPILAIMVGYVAISLLAQAAAHRSRKRMLVLAAELQHDKRANQADIDRVDFLLDTAMSWKVGVLLPIAIIGLLSDVALKRDVNGSKHWMSKDPRAGELAFHFFVSVAAANVPMACINAILLGVSLPLIVAARKGVRSSVTASTFRAAYGLRHSH
ncbi:hypothetical protein BV98_001477 [Sphingobium herbicidovorans NBRC 16415]|uniref:Uncharacterized protein n=1 Tax=Sphingobium herbicidovorans (strain ATCC 700291 / DSM 11019 / CCUG 56400 / KCTC 2939 / LMG 18315 / NBRC 16415 / MH) TaxID=1219045 RepID=A0A086PBJ7_SPHHM|nr:hypothetical protein [Sphingobium herbicidovorans]KFG90765.1 hypothetical protein BV98_001477 [Sphingobium herbicidovorans NBRC 16415]